MRKIVLVPLLNLFCLLAWGHNMQRQTDAQSRPSSIHRDIKLERAVSERYRKMMTLLQPEAKRKLSIASRALRKEMVKSPEPTDLYKIARAEVNKQFAGLSAAQSELLSFYVMADLAQLGSKLVDSQGKLGSEAELGETESLRLQMAMDRLSKLMTTLSNVLKKIDDTSDAIIQNLK